MAGNVTPAACAVTEHVATPIISRRLRRVMRKTRCGFMLALFFMFGKACCAANNTAAGDFQRHSITQRSCGHKDPTVPELLRMLAELAPYLALQNVTTTLSATGSIGRRLRQTATPTVVNVYWHVNRLGGTLYGTLHIYMSSPHSGSPDLALVPPRSVQGSKQYATATQCRLK